MAPEFFVEWRVPSSLVSGYHSWYDTLLEVMHVVAAWQGTDPPSREATAALLKGTLVETGYSLGRFLVQAMAQLPGVQFGLFSTFLIANSPAELDEMKRLVAKVDAGSTSIAFVEHEGSLCAFVVKKTRTGNVRVAAVDKTRPYSVSHRAFVVLLAAAFTSAPLGPDLDIDMDAIGNAINEKRVVAEI